MGAGAKLPILCREKGNPHTGNAIIRRKKTIENVMGLRSEQDIH